MPTSAPTINASQILDSAVNNIAANFLHEGLIALPVIGVALLGAAGLFVVFYWTARAFGWKLKGPQRRKGMKGILGNPRKVHLERATPFSFRAAFDATYSKFWNLQTPVSPTSSFFMRPSSMGGGLFEGRPFYGCGESVPGFGDGLSSLDDDEFADEYSDIDAEDARSGWYADPSYYASWTDDVGPDSAPGSQNGGVNQNLHDRDARYQFAQSVVGKISGGLTWSLVDHVSGESTSQAVLSGYFLGSDDQASWDFLTVNNGDGVYSDVSSADDIMRGAEKAWSDMFGWQIQLAPNQQSAFSAETTYHALRILEMARMREMGFEGSHSDFMDGLQGFELGADSEMYDDVDVDRGAYDY